jgi:predicted  nucleic acid-binding Zn-ribbon protein
MEQKLGIGIVVALVMQTAGGAYWLSQQVSAIETNQKLISELSVRVNEGTMVNMQRDITQLTTQVNLINEKLVDLEYNVGISPTYDDTDALFSSISGIANKLEAVVDALEDVFEDEHGIEFEIDEKDFWDID